MNLLFSSERKPLFEVLWKVQDGRFKKLRSLASRNTGIRKLISALPRSSCEAVAVVCVQSFGALRGGVWSGSCGRKTTSSGASETVAGNAGNFL